MQPKNDVLVRNRIFNALLDANKLPGTELGREYVLSFLFLALLATMGKESTFDSDHEKEWRGHASVAR